jgi:hypothetical protein
MRCLRVLDFLIRMKINFEKIDSNPREKHNSTKYLLITNALWLALSVSLLAFYILAKSSSFKNLMFHEDGILESSQAIFYFAATLMFFLKAWSKNINNKLFSFWCLLFGALLFVMGGEEISWGQRIFGFVTPAQLNGSNIQHEFNLHNINGVHQHIRLVGNFFVSVLFCFIPLSNRYLLNFRSLYTRWKLPVFPLSSILIVTISLLFMILPRLFFHKVIYEIDEIGEFYLALSWLIYAAEIYRNRFIQRFAAR